jgi:hypothetical protein
MRRCDSGYISFDSKSFSPSGNDAPSSWGFLHTRSDFLFFQASSKVPSSIPNGTNFFNLLFAT